MSKDDAISIMNNSNLTEKKWVFIKETFFFFNVKIKDKTDKDKSLIMYHYIHNKLLILLTFFLIPLCNFINIFRHSC